jgi:type IV secretory pathway component VirB8
MTGDDKTNTENATENDAETGQQSGLAGIINSAQPDYSKSTERVTMTDAERLAQKKRNAAIAWALVGFMVLIFTITVLRLGANIAAGAS